MSSHLRSTGSRLNVGIRRSTGHTYPLGRFEGPAPNYRRKLSPPRESHRHRPRTTSRGLLQRKCNPERPDLLSGVPVHRSKVTPNTSLPASATDLATFSNDSATIRQHTPKAWSNVSYALQEVLD